MDDEIDWLRIEKLMRLAHTTGNALLPIEYRLLERALEAAPRKYRELHRKVKNDTRPPGARELKLKDDD